ncbi:MAG: hypothetical protein H0U73_01815 [Tatlockia sp.]|nr:hypothetical protein [Tatlockia sp.]
MTKPIPAIHYTSKLSGKERRIVVVDGIPFGEFDTDSFPKPTWVPLAMLGGTKAFNIPPTLSSAMQKELQYVAKDYENYIVKHLAVPDNHISLAGGAIHCKQTLILSSQLNPETFDRKTLKSAGLTDKEIAAAKKPLAINPTMKIIKTPDEVNLWLIKQGAHIATEVLSDAFAVKLRSKFNYYYERAATFEYEGFEEKQRLYQSLGQIFEEVHDKYLNLSIDARKNNQVNCLDEITRNVENLQTTLEINESRNIIAQVLRWIKSVILACFCGTEEKESFKVSGNMHRFSGKATQTVTDLSEAMDYEILEKKMGC